MKQLTVLLLGTAFVLGHALTAPAAELSLDDFLPPQQGTAVTPSGPATTDSGSIHAETMQDGMAHAYQALMAEDGNGVRLVTTATGMGIIASATEGYTVYTNLNATLLSKRAAYTRAFAGARKELMANMDGLRNTCSTVVASNLVHLDTAETSATNTSMSTKERCGESVSGILAGYIVYSVGDGVDGKSVTMTIASSTKTRAAVDRVGGAVVVSSDVRAAWQHIVSDITNFATPPMGAKLISNPDTGENIVIGFGSAIVRGNENAALRRQLKDAADKQAKIRARSALVSFLQGDQVYWKGSFEESQFEGSEQFTIPVDEDGNTGDPRKFEETQSTFLNVMRQSDAHSITTSGQLPAGVQTKTFTSSDGHWQFAIAVYMSSATALSSQTGAEHPAADGRRRPQGGTGAPAADPASRPMRTQGGVNDNAPDPQGPSGQVSPKNDF